MYYTPSIYMLYSIHIRIIQEGAKKITHKGDFLYLQFLRKHWLSQWYPEKFCQISKFYTASWKR